MPPCSGLVPILYLVALERVLLYSFGTTTRQLMFIRASAEVINASTRAHANAARKSCRTFDAHQLVLETEFSLLPGSRLSGRQDLALGQQLFKHRALQPPRPMFVGITGAGARPIQILNEESTAGFVRKYC